MKRLNSFAVSVVKKNSEKSYNKSFHTKLFTLFASSESMMFTYANNYHPHFSFCYTFLKNDDGQWFMDNDTLVRVRKWVMHKAKTRLSAIRDYYHKWEADWNKYLILCRRLLGVKFKRFTDKQLWKEFENFYEHYCSAGSGAYITDCFMSTGEEDWLEALVGEELKRIKFSGDVTAQVRLLTSPAHLSFTMQEEEELIKLAVKLKKRFHRNFPSFELLKNSARDLYQAFIRHEKQFHWVKNNYYNVEHISAKNFYIIARKKIQKGEMTGEALRKWEHNRLRSNRNRKQQEKLLANLPVSAYCKNILQIARLFSEWKDVRKSGVYMGMYYFDKFIKEIGRRTKIAPRDLNFLVYDELHDILLKQKSFTKEIKERKAQAFFAVTPEGYFVAGGKKATPYFEYSKTGNFSDMQQLLGVSASPGIATGYVRLIRQTQEMKNFRNGEILVTNQTTPEFVPVMRKAAAIVTEQGGVTSHAAVISRELKKPCVIGTKIATQVFKDGDLVEVDANKGIARKLK